MYFQNPQSQRGLQMGGLLEIPTTILPDCCRRKKDAGIQTNQSIPYLVVGHLPNWVHIRGWP